MALYACDEDDLIIAADAEPGKIYCCLECFGPSKGEARQKLASPFLPSEDLSRNAAFTAKPKTTCSLKCKSKKSFRLRPFKSSVPSSKSIALPTPAGRSEKIVFEIQCSPMTDKEAEMRIRDYKSIGYDVVWLLDDKRYNKRVVRPAEEFLRRHSTYYMSIKQGWRSEYYDQFEIFQKGSGSNGESGSRSIYRKSRPTPKTTFSEDFFPKQIIHAQLSQILYRRPSPSRLPKQCNNALLANARNQLTVRKPNRLRSWLKRYLL